MASYSPFFSSGLLAPFHAYNPDTASSIDLSPIRPSSPMRHDGEDLDRSVTPTPTSAHGGSDLNTASNHFFPRDSSVGPETRRAVPATPSNRLRKRRSSLTVGSSQLTAIKSPARNANAALRYAHHSISICSPSRSRSGSLGTDGDVDVFGTNMASQGNSIMGRLRSGSVGGVLRPRRTTRRGPSMPLPMLAPPSAPLPPVPTFACHPSMVVRQPLAQRPHGQSSFHLQQAAGFKSARDRAYSFENGYTIDEEMKEN
ncbi:hypothetical protein HGRIS_005253 [Hohenbuehelia grisea]|uniref:Uncharacterized protein n=1 Tax=Hohenbuehelia grisea TaxID=104357 RepID=A0ABR3JEF3_9AGAR